MDDPDVDGNLTVDITEQFEMNEARGIFCPNWLFMKFDKIDKMILEFFYSQRLMKSIILY